MILDFKIFHYALKLLKELIWNRSFIIDRNFFTEREKLKGYILLFVKLVNFSSSLIDNVLLRSYHIILTFLYLSLMKSIEAVKTNILYTLGAVKKFRPFLNFVRWIYKVTKRPNSTWVNFWIVKLE